MVRSRASLAVLLATAGSVIAAPAAKKKKRPGATYQTVERTLALKARKTNSGSAELDRLLEERPAPASWSDSVLTTPVARILRSDRPDSGASSPEASPLVALRTATDPWIGTRYRSGGNGEGGFDCSGFVNRVLRSFGIALQGRSSPSFWTQGDPVAEKDLQPGDLVFFSDHSRRIGHVGIYLEKGTFVHASVKSGVIVSAIEERYYRRRYKGARRIPELRTMLENPSKLADASSR